MDRISRSPFCVFESDIFRNKQVFVSWMLTTHFCWLRLHMQGSEVRCPQPFKSRMFGAAIMFLRVIACLLAKCERVFGGNGISLIDVHYWGHYLCQNTLRFTKLPIMQFFHCILTDVWLYYDCSSFQEMYAFFLPFNKLNHDERVSYPVGDVCKSRHLLAHNPCLSPPPWRADKKKRMV